MKRTYLKRIIKKTAVYKIFSLSKFVLSSGKKSRTIMRRIKSRQMHDARKGKRYAVIFRWREHCGIFSHIITMLPALEYAEKHNMLPVIDLQDMPNAYKPDENYGNWWELFFEQPCGLSLESLREQRNIVVYDAEAFIDKRLHPNLSIVDDEMRYLQNRQITDNLRNTYHNCIRLNHKTKEYIDNTWFLLTGVRHVEGENNGFLGVRVRGSGYRLACCEGLSAVNEDELDHIILVAKNAMIEYGFKKIFLATEDYTALAKFQIAFSPDEVYYLKEDDRISVSELKDVTAQGVNVWLAQPEVQKQKTKSMYQHNFDYIAEIMCLTYCDGIISTRNSAGLLLPLMRNDWRYEHYI